MDRKNKPRPLGERASKLSDLLERLERGTRYLTFLACFLAFFSLAVSLGLLVLAERFLS